MSKVSRSTFLPSRYGRVAGNDPAPAQIATDADPHSLDGLRSSQQPLASGAPPLSGRWAGLWQFPTIEADHVAPAANSIGRQIGLPIRDLREIGQIHHTLTHRRYVFTAFIATASTTPGFSNRKWIRLEELNDFPLSRPQLKIAEMLRARAAVAG